MDVPTEYIFIIFWFAAAAAATLLYIGVGKKSGTGTYPIVQHASARLYPNPEKSDLNFSVSPVAQPYTTTLPPHWVDMNI